MYEIDFREFDVSIMNIECIKAATDPADRAEVLELESAAEFLEDVKCRLLHDEDVPIGTIRHAEYLISVFVDIPLVEVI